MPTDAKLVRNHFLAAAEMAAMQRSEYLAAQCGHDPDLRREVERLLAAHEQPASVLDRPFPAEWGSTRSLSPSEQPGTVIAGRYKLLEAIGEGGMGTVWVAEQSEPVRRKVALKLIKAGMDSRSVLARFDAERQALAVMDHPHIAKVFDGGLTELGRPFFVMEYVKGVPITEYCDATRLSVPERLQLFVQVCQAVQHAHQKGIIHRDLKPSNILVAPYDGQAVPKVIDFGLAKAIHQSLTEQTLHTAHETVLGTPLYMSPEQAQLNNIDVDTRSDIYSLGVLLYELLTGTTPLEKRRFKEAAWDEVKRIIREEDPPRPSARISSTAMLPSLAAGRQVEPDRLTKLVRGELDWIVMKSLEKDRGRRYDTAIGFAADVQRYLAGETVLAAPPGTRYRLAKFLRKHRTLLVTVTAFSLLLVGGTLFSLWQASRARRAERVALQALAEQKRARQAEADQRQQAEVNEQQARAAAAKARAVSEFLQHDLLSQADSRVQAARQGDVKPNLTVSEVLDRAAASLGRFGSGDELTEAELRSTIGNAYLGIGQSRRALPHLERAREIVTNKYGSDHEDTLRAAFDLGQAYYSAGRGEDARKLYQELFPLMEQKLGNGHPLTLACLGHLAMAIEQFGEPSEALPMYEKAYHRTRAEFGPDHLDTITAMNSLAIAYQHLGRSQEALPLQEEVLRIRRVQLGTSHPDTQTALNNLGTLYWRLGQLERSIPLFEEAYQLRRQTLGEAHPLTIRTQVNLGINYQDAGRTSEAIPLLEDALRRARPFAGAEQIHLPGFLEALAEAYTQVDDHAKAELLFRELYATAQQESVHGAGAASWQARLGLNLLQQQKADEAEPLLRSALAVRDKLEPESWGTFNTQSLLGGALLGQQNYAEAEPLLLKGYQGMKSRESTIPAQGKVRLPEAVDRLIELYSAIDQPDKMKAWQTERAQYPLPRVLRGTAPAR